MGLKVEPPVEIVHYQVEFEEKKIISGHSKGCLFVHGTLGLIDPTGVKEYPSLRFLAIFRDRNAQTVKIRKSFRGDLVRGR